MQSSLARTNPTLYFGRTNNAPRREVVPYLRGPYTFRLRIVIMPPYSLNLSKGEFRYRNLRRSRDELSTSQGGTRLRGRWLHWA